MKQYILHRTFITKDGSAYHKRSKPYLECELPELALQSSFATLVDDSTVFPDEPKTIEKNVVETKYNSNQTPNVVESHFQPKYHQEETPQEPVAEIDLKHLNAPDHVVQEKAPVVLGQASVEEIAALPYISRKVADRLVQALADGAIFSSYEDLDRWQKLGFGKSFESTGLLLPTVEVIDVPIG